MQAKGYPTKEPGWGSAEHKRHFLYVVFPNLSYDQKELGKFIPFEQSNTYIYKKISQICRV